MPNGARIYYLNRSQPPMLTQMVDTYISVTNDVSRLTSWLQTLDNEYRFWKANRTVSFTTPGGKSVYLLRYDVLNSRPRPEAYLPDVNAVEGGNFRSQQAADLYAAIASAAESGWDFSSRWVNIPRNHTAQTENLRQLRTNTIIPVDLNSIMYINQVALQKLHTMQTAASPHGPAMFYRREATRQQLAMWEVFWDDARKVWRDWDWKAQKRRDDFNAAVFWPFWSGAALTDPRANRDGNRGIIPLPKNHLMNKGPPMPPGHRDPYGVPMGYGVLSDTTDKSTACDYLIKPFDELEYILHTWPGGIATTFYNTSMQWDLPNAWPPEQLIVLLALDKTIQILPSVPSCPPETQKHLSNMQLRLAQNYITAAFCSWRITGGDLVSMPAIRTNVTDMNGTMFEKFDVTEAKGGAGSGGEYEVQTGFG
ncbi:hypothetical protein HK097_002919 [Rhizophlyctis rosea]|uniref:Trehalase n=1 Tax=Rhizophlyctis rosea TaxID=64517 RepID=A0AAD5S3V3_9FUNG|nr:hypothetical protein HK097_002919 [Rhizophlyctis rosea]